MAKKAAATASQGAIASKAAGGGLASRRPAHATPNQTTSVPSLASAPTRATPPGSRSGR